jgi:DNA-binding NtrC family response regulator/pSer/pThr/pTyr-binding forkhead associated (FHA) protein
MLVHRRSGTTECTLREGTEIVFGRDPDCGVRLTDSRVSRRHASVRIRNGVLEFVDLGSRNGSTIDGERSSANTVVPIRATSVVRIGDAVLVFEPSDAASSEQWFFDLASFETTVARLLAESKPGRVGLVEVRWESATLGTTTTAADSAPPPGLRSVLARLAGPRGVIGIYEASKVLLVIPDVERERLEECATQLKRICGERNVPSEIKTALSTNDTRTLHALENQGARPSEGPRVPPVVFKGGLRSVETLFSKLDASDAPVLVTGETGVGKDVLARALHGRSRRAAKPFLALNSAAFTDALFESELFGHERGAFTGATQSKTGLLESAAGGTVFLDEIGEMPLGLQAKLLRVVENREVYRVGALQARPIDVRFIFATNRDLRQEIDKGTFRRDLFFRIGTITLTIPPLRERLDEIVPLTEAFIAAAAKRIGCAPPRLLPETAGFLQAHAWPGNVRELKNIIDLAVLVHEGDMLRPADIPIERYIESVPQAPQAPPAPPPSARLTPAPEKSERDQMLEALEKCVWNQSEAAKLLGMPRRTFVKRLAQYDLPRPRKRDA